MPVYLKDVANITDSTEDIRSVLRINGRSGVRMQVQKQSGTNTVEVSDAVRQEVDRINREVPGVKLSVLDDSAVYINRSISSVKEHALIGSVLVVLIIFVFLQSFRSTIIVCTSIPISVIGTFALLYFAGFTLNTMTFGGLALGIGMVVDASIVVLENSYRHMEKGKDRVTASVDGSEEVWSAIVASILTHIAVFVPLLFLSGHLQHPLPAAVGCRDLLAARPRCWWRSRSCPCCARSCCGCPRRQPSGRVWEVDWPLRSSAASTAWMRAIAVCSTWR